MASETVVKLRNYALQSVDGEERINHQRVEPARVPEFEEVRVQVDTELGDDPEEILVNVAPKKANWDLRRDIADKLARVEGRTQAAMVRLMSKAQQWREGEAHGEG